VKKREYIGTQAILKLPAILTSNNCTKILLVSGENAFAQTGMESFFKNYLTNFEIIRFSEFSANPKLKDIEKGIKLYKEQKFDVVIAIGGGSCIDTAKLINFFGANNFSPAQWIKNEIKNSPVKQSKLIAVPTTAGSGSEATHFAVLYIDGTKYSVAHEAILPDYSIIDPNLISSMPASLAASSGFDALCQAIEAFWSVNSTEESDNYAREAIPLLMDNIQASVINPNAGNRLCMVRAAHLAGKAINISKTTGPHAFSYIITSRYNIAHGHAVAIMMLPFLKLNFSYKENDRINEKTKFCLKEKLQQLLSLTGCKYVDELCDKWKMMMNATGLSYNLKDYQCNLNDIDFIVNNVNQERLKNNPVMVDKETIKKYLLQVYNETD
jgi:alcohol dehydrogenase class IV